jgi:hypothetical protein
LYKIWSAIAIAIKGSCALEIQFRQWRENSIVQGKDIREEVGSQSEDADEKREKSSKQSFVTMLTGPCLVPGAEEAIASR